MNLALTAGEQRMLSHAQEQVVASGAIMTSPINLSELRLAKRGLQQAHATLEYLVREHARDGEPETCHRGTEASRTEATGEHKSTQIRE
jgi:hypothetical protein